MQFSKAPRSSERDFRVFLGMIAVIVGPGLLTLRTVETPAQLSLTHPNPTPYGYTWSLLIFVLPVIVLETWFLRRPRRELKRRAFWGTIGLFTGAGLIMDIFFGHVLFRFENPGATLGLYFPSYDPSRGWLWVLPIEEFFFYLSGTMFMLLVYIWADLFWFEHYDSAEYHREARNLYRLLAPDFRLALLGGLVILLAVLYKKLGPHTYQAGFPTYFVLQTLALFTPTFMFFRTVKPFINWRAFSLTFFSLGLVSMFWEATLGVPYRWWGYNPEHMLGIFIGAWANLPLEAVLLWGVSGWINVMTYELLRMYWHNRMSQAAWEVYYAEIQQQSQSRLEIKQTRKAEAQRGREDGEIRD